jgi:hypothetical protein
MPDGNAPGQRKPYRRPRLERLTPDEGEDRLTAADEAAADRTEADQGAEPDGTTGGHSS